MTMTERTTVRLPEDLVRRAKKKALAEGRSLTALIEDGLRKVLDEHRPAARGKRVLVRVRAGFSFQASSFAMQEMEDLSALTTHC